MELENRILTNEELEQVAGGTDPDGILPCFICPLCGRKMLTDE